MGGALWPVEKGFFQDEIRQNAYSLKKNRQTKKVIVGVNKYQNQHDVEPLLNVMEPEIEIKQVRHKGA